MSDRVIVLAGGLSPERDVSIRSGRRIAEALRDTGIQAEVRDVDAALIPLLRTDPPACVIPLVHGVAGEDGALQDVLELLDLPYVGSAPDACRQAFDKAVAAPFVRSTGIAVPDAVALPHATFRELGAKEVLAAIVSRLGLPLVVKPTRGGSALGVSVITSQSELPAAMVGAFAYGDSVLIQRYITGTEIAVAVVDDGDGSRALPAVEIVPDSGLYDYAARYTAGTTEFFAPARLAPEAAAGAASVAITAHTVLGLRDWSRSDLIVDGEGVVWYLEVNVAPGMTETSLFPQAVTAAGERLGELTAALVKRAIDRG